jgi:hypothetical protein
MGPELKLAIACSRWCISGEGGEDVRRLSIEIDPTAFLRFIRRHRVQGLVAKALNDNAISISPEATKEIAREALSVGARNLQAAAESIRLLDEFENASVPLLFFKGLTLSALAYGDPFVKMSSDIDILVDPSDLPRAAEILSARGFRPTIPAAESSSPAFANWHAHVKESVWKGRGLVLELHTRLADNPELIPTVGMDSERQLVSLAGYGSLPTLTTDDLFAYLCVHGATCVWFRLKWIVDLAALLHSAGGAAIAERMYREARKRAAGRAPGQALLLADALGLIDLPTELRREIEADRVTRTLAKAALRELLHSAEPTQRPLGTGPTHVSQLFLSEGWLFTLSEAKRQVREVAYRRLGIR